MAPTCAESSKGFIEKHIFIDNLLVRFHLIIEMSILALCHGSLNSLFQVAYIYLPREGFIPCNEHLGNFIMPPEDLFDRLHFRV